MPDTAAVRPDEVPAAILDVAARTYASAYAGLAPEQLRETELNALRAAVAAALTADRAARTIPPLSVAYALDADTFHVLTTALGDYAAIERDQAENEGGHESRTKWAEIADRMSGQAEAVYFGEGGTGA